MSKNKLSTLIEKYQERSQEDIRDYIGASSIGSDCLRKIWYQYKGVKAEGVPAKTRRTWAIGKHLEGLVIEWLRQAGVNISLTVESYYSKKLPIFQGHFDGLILFGKKEFILEIKTAKDASFKIFINKGLKIWNPQYYAQVQAYMGMSGIKFTYILVLNKDNSDLSDELIKFDTDYYEKLEDKAIMIANASCEPPRISASPLWYQCKMCSYNKLCHE